MEVSNARAHKNRSLVVDSGNTRIKFGVFEDRKWIHGVGATPETATEELTQLIDEYRPANGILSSVRKPDEVFLQNLQRVVSLHIFTSETRLPLQLAYETPTTLGRDRIADAVAGWTLCGHEDCLVIDCGTCITYNIVSENHFTGGAISPGMRMRYSALHQFTHALPEVEPDLNFEGFGKNTENSIRSGVQTAILCEVEGMLKKICSENAISNVYITGGDHAFFEKGLKTPTFAHPHLTLLGLNEILLYNLA